MRTVPIVAARVLGLGAGLRNSSSEYERETVAPETSKGGQEMDGVGVVVEGGKGRWKRLTESCRGADMDCWVQDAKTARLMSQDLLQEWVLRRLY
jgi:hypothetical protein